MTDHEKDWGRFFKQLFEESDNFTLELMKQNEKLRERVALLEHAFDQHPNNQLMERVALLEEELSQRTASGSYRCHAHDDSEQMCQRCARLQEELSAFKQRLVQVEQENLEFAEKYLEIERQNSAFASLYVASYQLHSTLDFELVLTRISEVVINLIGGERFALYIFDPRNQQFTLACGEEVDDRLGERVPMGDNFLGRAASSGMLQLGEELTDDVHEEQALAVLPFIASDQIVGVLVVYKLLVQKDGFESVDLELFDLLAGHAATALMAASLYSRTHRKAKTLEGLLNLLKTSSQPELVLPSEGTEEREQ